MTISMIKKYIQLVNDWISGNNAITYINNTKFDGINFIDCSNNIIRFYNKENDAFNKKYEIEEDKLESLDLFISTIHDGYVLCKYEDLCDMTCRVNENQMNCLSLFKTEEGFDFEIKLRTEEKEDYE